MTTLGPLIFEHAEELDFVGRWEVVTTPAAVRAGENSNVDTVVTIAEHADPSAATKDSR